jgi:hypothetical protein
MKIPHYGTVVMITPSVIKVNTQYYQNRSALAHKDGLFDRALCHTQHLSLEPVLSDYHRVHSLDMSQPNANAKRTVHDLPHLDKT